MQLIFSTTNHWPQNEIDDQKGLSIASTGTTRVMEKQPSQLEQKPQEALKCPRCDSSNTKFCYYNNYSLSQPRHFCKACKRYWTRGGTLRNVPVGGGCRKNKKIKRSISAVDPPSLSSSPTTTSSNPNSIQPHNPLFYGLPTTNPNSELSTFPYPTFNSRVSTVDAVSGFDPQPQMSCFGLGFSISSSSGVLMPTNHEVGNNGNYQNEFPSYNKHIIQDVVTSSNSLPSSYSMFGSSTNSPTIASLLGSSLPQQKFFNSGGFQGLVPFEELQMGGNMNMKEVKREEVRNLNFPNNCQNHIEQTNPSDPTLYWSANGAWLDPTNMGSSVPSLI